MFKVLELVKYMWTFYKDRIIQNYCAFSPDIEEIVVLRSVLGKLMTACQTIHNADLIIWWVDTEGTKYFDMTTVKTHMRGKLMYFNIAKRCIAITTPRIKSRAMKMIRKRKCRDH